MAITAPPAITAAPTPAPQRNDRTTFSARVDAFVTWLIASVAQFAAVATNAYNNAVETYNNAAAAAASQTVAVAAANFKGAYADRVGAANVPYSVSHLGHFWMLLSNLADVTTKVPGTDAEWQWIGAAPWIRKTAAYTAASGDRIKASTAGGAWPLTFPPAPANGDEVEVQDVDGTFNASNLTLLVNSKKIMGYTTSYILDTPCARLCFVYDATLGDWRF